MIVPCHWSNCQSSCSWSSHVQSEGRGLGGRARGRCGTLWNPSLAFNTTPITKSPSVEASSNLCCLFRSVVRSYLGSVNRAIPTSSDRARRAQRWSGQHLEQSMPQLEITSHRRRRLNWVVGFEIEVERGLRGESFEFDFPKTARLPLAKSLHLIGQELMDWSQPSSTWYSRETSKGSIYYLLYETKIR